MPREDTQFKKGQVANPKGRPKGSKSYRDSLKRVLEAESMSVDLYVNGQRKHIEVESEPVLRGIAARIPIDLSLFGLSSRIRVYSQTNGTISMPSVVALTGTSVSS